MQWHMNGHGQITLPHTYLYSFTRTEHFVLIQKSKTLEKRNQSRAAKSHHIIHVSLPISQNENWEFPFPAPAHIATYCQANTHTAHGTFSHAMHQGIIIIIFASIFILRNEYIPFFGVSLVFSVSVCCSMACRIYCSCNFLFLFHSCLISFIHNSINSFTSTISQSNGCEHECDFLHCTLHTHTHPFGRMRFAALGAGRLRAHIYDSTVCHFNRNELAICIFRRSSHSSTFPAIHPLNTISIGYDLALEIFHSRLELTEKRKSLLEYMFSALHWKIPLRPITSFAWHSHHSLVQ